MRSTMWGLWWSRVQRLEGRGTRDYICTRQSNHCRSLLLQPINRTVLCLATFALYKLSNTCYFLIHNWMRTNGKQIKDLRFHDGNVYRLCMELTPLFWHSSEDCMSMIFSYTKSNTVLAIFQLQIRSIRWNIFRSLEIIFWSANCFSQNKWRMESFLS